MPQSSIFSIFDNAGERLALSFNGLTMNDPASDPDSRIEVVRIRPRIQARAVVDVRQHSDGLEVQDAFKSTTTLEIGGRILRTSRAALYDACADMSERFDPAILSRDNPTTHGFLALDGSAPTADAATYPTGLIAKRVYARPMESTLPVIVTGGNLHGRAQPSVAAFVTNFLIRDPRVYLQSESSHTIDQTSETAANTKAAYPSWPTITFNASASATQLEIDNTTDDRDALVIDLTNLDGQQVVVDMEQKKITVAGIRRDERYVSGEWFELLAGNNAITVASLTGISNMTMTWRPALAF